MLAAQSLAPTGAPTRVSFLRALAGVTHSSPVSSEVDLLIRTGGERRLSDFLLWESAYAELYFTDCLWPDFNEQELALALTEFAQRERRFGGLAAGEVVSRA